jgi:type IV pilus assembly protein PilE
MAAILRQRAGVKSSHRRARRFLSSAVACRSSARAAGLRGRSLHWPHRGIRQPPVRTVHVMRIRRLSLGFTLIEMMIVVAILGILAAIGIPSYTDYVRRGQLPEAMTMLSDYRVKMEQYFQDNRAYSTDGNCGTGAGWAGFAPTDGKYFTYSCATTGTFQTFTLTATGSSGQATGHVYTVDHNGAKRTTKFKGDTVNKSCWLIRGDEC